MKTFISHSSKDKPLVLKIAEQLRSENVWVDLWDMEAGDVLSDEIEKGIDTAKNFLVILSKNSIGSSWVKYELNMAIYKFLQDNSYRLIIVRVDDVEVPLKLQPFLRIDISSSDSTERIINILQKQSKSQSSKRPFINRSDEIDALTGALYDDEIKFINVIGLYGIGKTALIKETLKRVYTQPDIVEINLSSAHFGARLTLELCSKAGIEIPADGSAVDKLLSADLLALETILHNNTFVMFNHIETVLDDNGRLNDDLTFIVQHFAQIGIAGRFPFIFLSTRWLDFHFIDKKAVQFLKINGLTDRHLGFILQAEIERIDPLKKIDNDTLLKVAKHLHGYPLAGRLAAPIFVKYGAEYILQNMLFINKLKIDIAEDIISKIALNEFEIQLMELLAIFEHPLSPIYLVDILGLGQEELNSSIDNLVSFNLLESNGDALILHPLVNDFYMKVVRTTSSFATFAEKLANLSKSFLNNLSATHRDYVYCLTNTCRMLFYCGKHVEARKLRYDLIGELRNAAIKLYERRNYEQALIYCTEYLDTKPDDAGILYYKARCLSRIGEMEQSISLLQELIKNESRPKLLSKYNFGIGRAFVENNDKDDEEKMMQAQKYFLESIKIQEDGTALQSMAELLYRMDKYLEAESFIKRKLKDNPTDAFALNIYSDILWTLGRKSEAIEKIYEALRLQPKNPNFNFRAGRFLQDSQQPENAYSFYYVAIKSDETYYDARLSLCDVCLDLGKLEEAKKHIDWLQPILKDGKREILESILANYYLKLDNVDAAEKISKKLLQKHRSVQNLGLQAKIEVYKFRILAKDGLQILANSDKEKAIELINEGLRKEPTNVHLKRMLESLN